MSKATNVRRWARIGMSLALTTGLSAAAVGQTTTHTTLTVETREVDGHTVATAHAAVVAADGSPTPGVVTLLDAMDGRKQNLASAALDSKGEADIELDSLVEGNHSLSAVFNGDSTRAASHSEAVTVRPLVSVTPDFTVAIAPSSLTLKQGASGTVELTITPTNGFTGFLSLSLSGTGQTTVLPVGLTDSFSPANIQVTSASPVTAILSIQTSTAGGTSAQNGKPGPPSANSHQNPLMLAVLLPGMLGLSVLAAKRKRLGTTLLVVCLGAFTLTGVSGCAARYRYLNHGPGFGGTALGSYTLNVTAQTSNGVAASSHTTPLALTVD